MTRPAAPVPSSTRTVPAVLLACALAAAVGCSAAPAGDRADATPVVASPSADPGPRTPAPPARTPPVAAPGQRLASDERRVVTLAFAGDVHGERQIASALAAGTNPLQAIAPVLRAADVAVVNLETAIGHGGTEADKAYTFQAPPGLLAALAEAGVDVVSLANNHSLDFGVGLLPAMLDAVGAHGLRAVGAGPTAADAYAPATFSVGGRRVAVVGLTRVIPRREWAATHDRAGLASAYDARAAAAAVERAAADADHVVVTVHWGVDGADCPDEHQLALADALLAAGADVVAGHHPHVLQAVEQRADGLVAYSLGNFLWYSQSPLGRLTGVLLVHLDDRGVVGWELVPAIIRPSGSPEPVTGAEARMVHERIAAISPVASACVDDEGPDAGDPDGAPG